MTTRERLGDMLRDLGFDVYDEDIVGVTGYYRRADVYRWEVNNLNEGPSIASWDTMTDCVRWGIYAVDCSTPESEWSYRVIEIFAKKQKPTTEVTGG